MKKKRCPHPRDEQDALYWTLIGRFNDDKPDEQKGARFNPGKRSSKDDISQSETKRRKPSQVILCFFIFIGWTFLLLIVPLTVLKRVLLPGGQWRAGQTVSLGQSDLTQASHSSWKGVSGKRHPESPWANTVWEKLLNYGKESSTQYIYHLGETHSH